MPTLGRFLELSLPVPDIRASLEFYLALGFTELMVNDIRPYPYAVVTDGQVVLGLHGAGLDTAALAFVRPGLAAHARRLADLGTRFTFQRLADDEFNEAGLGDPDGHLLVLMEARTFSAGMLADAPLPRLGRSTEISLRSLDPQASSLFWLEAGFAPGEVDTGEDRLALLGPGITIGLRRDLPWAGPVLRFDRAAAEGSLQALAARGIGPTKHAAGDVLTAPEGTRLLLATA